MTKNNSLSCISSSVLLVALAISTSIFLFLLSPSLLSAETTESSVSEQGEIVVTSQAHYWTGASSARVTMLIQSTGRTAQEAAQTADKAQNNLADSLAKILPGASLITRGEHISSASQKGAPVTTNTAVSISRYIAIETNSLKEISKIIDTALAHGASSVSDIDYFTKDGERSQSSAIDKATEKARGKANDVAKLLGIKLGPVISATVTEEPLGATLRQKMQRGIDISRFSEQDGIVYVNIRFSVIPQEVN